MTPEPNETWHLDTRHLGRRVLVYDRTGSTNTLAAALSTDPANAGVVVLAREQSAGRGQHGRTWTCQPDDGVLLSVLLFPPSELRRPALLTAWAAVAVGETILQTIDVQARIKWPNDVLIRGKKVSGILIESSVSRNAAVVAGIGLNVRQSAERFTEADLPEAGSLAMFADNPPATAEVARRLITQLDEEYGRLLEGDLSTLEACWKWRLGLLGRPVVAKCVDGTSVAGRLLDVGLAGVRLALPDAGLRVLPPERVRHLRPA